MIDKLTLTKNVVSIVVGAGASSIATGIIKNNVAPGNEIQKVTIPAATLVLGMMVSDATKKYTDAKIDEIADWWKKNFKKTADS